MTTNQIANPVRNDSFLAILIVFLSSWTLIAEEGEDPPFADLAGHWFHRGGGISLNLQPDGTVNVGTFGAEGDWWRGRLEWAEEPPRLRGDSIRDRRLPERGRGHPMRLIIDFPEEQTVPLRLRSFDGDRLRITGRFKGVSLEMIQPVMLSPDGDELLGEWVERGRDGPTRWVEIRTFEEEDRGTYLMRAIHRRQRSYIDREAPFMWWVDGPLLILAFGDEEGSGYPMPHVAIEANEERLTIFNQASGVASSYERSKGAVLPEVPRRYQRAEDPEWGFGPEWEGL